MKSFFINLFLFLTFINVSAQTKKSIVCSEDNKPISDALLIIGNTPKYITDSIGSVYINSVDFDKEITIRHLNFETKSFVNWNNQDTLFLLGKKYNLDEIELVAKKKKIKTKQIFPTKNFRNVSFENWGKSSGISENIEIAVFFPNKNNIQTKIIKKVLIPTNDYKVIENLVSMNTSKRKNAKYSPFKINLYTVDSIIGIPKDKIFEESFIIKCELNEEFAILEFDKDEEFKFPKEGVFIVIKNLTKEEYKELGYDFVPGIKQIGVSKNNKFLPYFRYLHQGENALWRKQDYIIDRNKTYYIGIEVEEQ